jgi:hypothetical protein
MKPQIGEAWKIRHTRKGEFTIIVKTDPSHEWFTGEVVAGKATFMSQSNRDEGRGTLHDDVPMRTSFVTFLKRIEI